MSIKFAIQWREPGKEGPFVGMRDTFAEAVKVATECHMKGFREVSICQLGDFIGDEPAPTKNTVVDIEEWVAKKAGFASKHDASEAYMDAFEREIDEEAQAMGYANFDALMAARTVKIVPTTTEFLLEMQLQTAIEQRTWKCGQCALFNYRWRTACSSCGAAPEHKSS